MVWEAETVVVVVVIGILAARVSLFGVRFFLAWHAKQRPIMIIKLTTPTVTPIPINVLSEENNKKSAVGKKFKLLSQFRSRLSGTRYTVESRLKDLNLALISFCVPRNRVRRILFEREDILQFRPGIERGRIHWRSFPCNHMGSKVFL